MEYKFNYFVNGRKTHSVWKRTSQIIFEMKQVNTYHQEQTGRCALQEPNLISSGRMCAKQACFYVCTRCTSKKFDKLCKCGMIKTISNSCGHFLETGIFFLCLGFSSCNRKFILVLVYFLSLWQEKWYYDIGTLFR